MLMSSRVCVSSSVSCSCHRVSVRAQVRELQVALMQMNGLSGDASALRTSLLAAMHLLCLRRITSLPVLCVAAGAGQAAPASSAALAHAMQRVGELEAVNSGLHEELFQYRRRIHGT
jgi:hypothetical protein